MLDRFRFQTVVSAMMALLAAPLCGQPPDSASRVVHLEETPVFRVTTVAKTAKAVNYRHRGGATKIDFAGTALLPRASGQAKVESKKGYIEIEVEFRNLVGATKFGAEYLTYAMWAITPEGRAVNLGEILLDKQGRGKLNVTTELQVFGLVVTAEPYFAVRVPSDVVVMENEIREDTAGKIHVIDAQYELLQRGQYAKLSNPLSLGLDLKNVPLELYEARNAMQIAASLGADRYASETFGRAEASLKAAESLQQRKARSKDIAQAARQTVQFAEDARELAVKREEQERLATERREAAEREARARATAEKEAIARAEAEALRQQEAELRAQAEQATDAAERRRLEAELAEARANAAMQEALRDKQEAEMLIAQAQNEAAQARDEREMLATAKAAAESAAEAARREREMAQEEAGRLALLKENAEAAAASAQRERDEMQARMQNALSKVLETRESARGLILNLPDVLFDFGKSSLRGEAREILSRVAGIFLVTPGYQLGAEGHTDSIGSEESNQILSENRARAVYEYLIESGLAADRMSTAGFGKSRPVASNDTNEGRQQNRRVEIVVLRDDSDNAVAGLAVQ